MPGLVRRVGLGATLGVDATGGSTFVVIGSIVDAIAGPECKADEIDISLLTEKWKTFAAGPVDSGSVTFQIAYDPADASTTTLTGLLNSGAVAAWQVTLPGPTPPPPETFLGLVSGLGREVKKGNLITMSCTIKVSGPPGYAGV